MNKIFSWLILVTAVQTAPAAETPASSNPANDPEVVAEPLPAKPAAPAPRQRPAERAPDYGKKFAWVLEGALEFGGDAVAKVGFTDGSTQNVRAGQGLTLAAGGQYRASRKSPFSITGTLGYKFVETQDANSSIGIDRLTLELTGRYRFTPHWWLGGGLVNHNNTKFDGDGFSPDIRFKDAIGVAAEFGWRWIALSYTKISYEYPFPGIKDADASNFGLVGRYAFD